MAHSVVQDVTTCQAEVIRTNSKFVSCGRKKNPTVVIFNFKKGKHIKMRKLLEKKFKRAANRVK